MTFIEKLRSMSLLKRKIVLWVTVILVGLILGTVWTWGVSNNFKKLKSTNMQEDLNIPDMPNLNR